jgi:conjugative relaxase-like TrwC/TraI family protein
LSIGKLVVGQQLYCEQQVAQGRDDYYSGRGEAPGEWVGAGARALGLEGRVGAEQFNALIVGADPRDSSRRLRNGPEPKVGALDLTFSAPKSVSGAVRDRWRECGAGANRRARGGGQDRWSHP